MTEARLKVIYRRAKSDFLHAAKMVGAWIGRRATARRRLEKAESALCALKPGGKLL